MQYNILQQLCNAGFLVPTRNDEALFAGKGNEFKFSHLGVILLKILYGETVLPDFFYTESESANIMTKEKSKSESDKNSEGFVTYDNT